MILPFLMAASGRPELKSAYLRGRSVLGYPSGGTEPITIPNGLGGSATLVFIHTSRTNSSTGSVQLGTVDLSGIGSFTRRAGNDTGGIADNPTSVWTRDISGLAAGAYNIVWDYTGSSATVAATVGIWVVYGRPHTFTADMGGTINRAAGGIAIQAVRTSGGSISPQGYTADDFVFIDTGLSTRMGRWFGVSAGTHSGGSVNINFTPV